MVLSRGWKVRGVYEKAGDTGALQYIISQRLSYVAEALELACFYHY